MSRILVVDDDSEIRELLRRILLRENHTVICASNGDEALKLFAENPADLVITDIIMPVKEGLQTIKELKQIAPGVKIIAISGGGLIEADKYLKIAKSIGANYTINKPFGRKEILDAVTSVTV